MYVIRCTTPLPLPDAAPGAALWLVNPALGLGCSAAGVEAHRFTLDEVEKMRATLNTCNAVGTTTRFSALWAWEVLPESALYTDLPRFADTSPFRCRFLVNRRPREWVQYHPDLAAADAAFRTALAQEYRGCSVVADVVVDAVPT